MNAKNLIELEAQLDGALTEFKLLPDERGELPWEKSQREKRNRRLIATGGAAAVAAGAALGHRKVMKNYGGDAGGGPRGAYREAGRDALRTAGDVGKGIKAKAAPMVGQAKEKVGEVAGRAGKFTKTVGGRMGQSWKMTGTMKTPLMDRLKKLGKTGLRSIKGVKFQVPGGQLTQLSAQLDEVLTIEGE